MVVLQWSYDLGEVGGGGGSSELMWLISGTQESLFICCGQRRIGYSIRTSKVFRDELSNPTLAWLHCIHTVRAKLSLKFTFRFRTIAVLQYEPSSKKGIKFYYGSVVCTVSMVFGRAKHLHIYTTAASHVKHCSSCDVLGLSSLFLMVLVLCQ